MSEVIGWTEAMYQQMMLVKDGYDQDTVRALQKAKQETIYLQDVLGKFPIKMSVEERLEKLRAVNGKLCNVVVHGPKSIQVQILIDRVAKEELLPVYKPNSWMPVKETFMKKERITHYVNDANPRIKPMMGKTFNRKGFPTDVLDKQGQVMCVLDEEFMRKHYEQYKPRNTDDVPMSQLKDFLNREFSFIWRFDKRGRTYSHGHQINVQGDKYRKGMINFANYEPLTKSGVAWCYRYIADLAGYGSKTFKDREVIGKAIHEGWKEYPLLKKNPIITKLLDREIKVGMPWNVPVELDAVNSGLQVLGLATSCENTLKLTCVTGNKRNDAYAHVAECIDESLTRDDIKFALMTHYYNSKARPKKDLGKENYEVFLKVCKKEFKGPERFKYWVNLMWDDRKTFDWTMPDGFKVNIPTFVHEEDEIKSLKRKGYKLRFGQYVHKPNGNYRHLLANVTHSVDAYICRLIIREFSRDLLTIHDAYLVHPNHADELRKVYKQVLVRVYQENPIKTIIRDLFGFSPEFTEEREAKVFPEPSLEDSISKGVYGVC